MSVTGSKDLLPKRAVWYWGGSPMSFLRYMSLVSFRKYHPDWDMTLVVRSHGSNPHRWKEQQDTVYYSGRDYMAEVPGLRVVELEKEYPHLTRCYENQVSDILGWAWVSHGGMKCDMDLLWRAPINYELIKGVCVGIWQYLNAFPVGVVLGNEFGFFDHLRKKAVERIQNNRAEFNYQEVGPNLLRDEFSALKESYDITVLPNSWLYPFVDNMVNWKTMCAQPFICGKNRPSLPSDCVAVHWYAGSIVVKEWNIKSQEEICAADNLIGDIVRAVLQ